MQAAILPALNQPTCIPSKPQEVIVMLVRFESDVGGFTMFGDVAVQLLKMMGHSGTVPSALLAPDIPAAIERLQAALERQPSPSPPVDEVDAHGEKREPPVSIRTRAVPLIDLLARAARRGSDVTWR
jgi:hypothetical protein